MVPEHKLQQRRKPEASLAELRERLLIGPGRVIAAEGDGPGALRSAVLASYLLAFPDVDSAQRVVGEWHDFGRPLRRPDLRVARRLPSSRRMIDDVVREVLDGFPFDTSQPHGTGDRAIVPIEDEKAFATAELEVIAALGRGDREADAEVWLSRADDIGIDDLVALLSLQG
jgi:hypothetical protein